MFKEYLKKRKQKKEKDRQKKIQEALLRYYNFLYDNNLGSKDNETLCNIFVDLYINYTPGLYESPDGTEQCLERARKIMLDGNLFKDTDKKVANDIMKKREDENLLIIVVIVTFFFLLIVSN